MPQMEILGYIAILEFHKNGNPHYHLIIHFADKAFREHDLQKAWKHGELHIREFSSRGDYLDFFPYLLKDPLRFPGEAHQVMPPQDWLDKYPKISRYLSSRNIRLGAARPNRKRSQGKNRKATDESTKRRKENNKSLKKCGESTSVRITTMSGITAWYKLPIDYYEIASLPGQYGKDKAYYLDGLSGLLELLGRPRRCLKKGEKSDE